MATTAFENSKNWFTKFNIEEADKKSQELLETFSGVM